MKNYFRNVISAAGLLSVMSLSAYSLPPYHSIVRWAASADIGVIASDPQHLMVVRSNGTIVTTIALDSPVGEVAISDDGQMLAYATAKNGLTVSKFDGSGKVVVDAGVCQALHWSKDDSVLIYTLQAPSSADPTSGQLTIYAVHADGSGKTQVYSRAYSAM